MLSQVGSLGARYNEWVIAPVDRKLRLFENPFLESLTITPWYVVPLMWVPIICYLIVYGTRKYIKITDGKIKQCFFKQFFFLIISYFLNEYRFFVESSPLLPVIMSVVFGIFLWTLIEYSLHRWVFHMEPSGKYRAMIYFHFVIHGLHHKVIVTRVVDTA